MAAVAYAPRAPTAPLVAAGLRGGGDGSATHRPDLRSIDRRSKSASDPRTLLAPPPIPAATPAASSALQRAEKRRGGTRPAMHDEGSAGRASAGPVAPSAHDCRRPDDRRRAAADGGSAPLPPRRRWEGHWWWPGRPSAAARGARAAVAACRRTTSKCPLTTSKCPLRRPAPRAILFSTKQNSSQLRKLKRAGWKH